MLRNRIAVWRSTSASARRFFHRRPLRLEAIEARIVLSAVSFSPAMVIEAPDFASPQAIFAADLDADGDVDALVAAGDGTVAWYENLEGAGTFGAQRVITTQTDEARSVFAADLDGDGDLDVLSASSGDNKIAWYENTDGLGAFGPQRVVTTAAAGASSVHAADLDGDGDIDILSASRDDDRVAWYENTDGRGTFGPARVITTDARGARSVFAADLDGDGDTDVLSGSADGKVAWYRNMDGQGTFGDQQVITSDAVIARSVYAADLDQDGDVDVLSASGASTGKIAWYENTDGKGTFGPQRIIDIDSEDDGQSVVAADVDGDGDLDVVAGSYARVGWYENTDGAGTFGPVRTVTSTFSGDDTPVFAADVDGDGDVDILSAASDLDLVAWYPNTDAAGSFGTPRNVSTNALVARSAVSADVDGDGDLDAIAASFGGVAWYQNTDGTGRFGLQRPISTSLLGVLAVAPADVDGDGDVDVVAVASGSASVGNRIVWYENRDGQGDFGPQRTVSLGISDPRAIFAGDVDGDGDVDVLSAANNAQSIAWYENTDGRGLFAGPRVVAANLASPQTIVLADVDGDGDGDAVFGFGVFSNGGTIAWSENTDGAGQFGPVRSIITGTAPASSLFAADVDRDGDADLVASSSLDNAIAWYENTDGAGSFGPRNVITTEAAGAASVVAADIDGDGDLDAVSASSLDEKIAWYENTDGQGQFGPQQVIASDADGARSVVAADVDGDGRADVLSASSQDDKIAWYRNLGLLGDMDFSGVVDFDDVEAFVLGLEDSAGYEAIFGEPALLHGDVDRNGVFDFDDIRPFVDLLGGETATASAAMADAAPVEPIGFATDPTYAAVADRQPAKPAGREGPAAAEGTGTGTAPGRVDRARASRAARPVDRQPHGGHRRREREAARKQRDASRIGARWSSIVPAAPAGRRLL